MPTFPVGNCGHHESYIYRKCAAHFFCHVVRSFHVDAIDPDRRGQMYRASDQRYTRTGRGSHCSDGESLFTAGPIGNVTDRIDRFARGTGSHQNVLTKQRSVIGIGVELRLTGKRRIFESNTRRLCFLNARLRHGTHVLPCHFVIERSRISRWCGRCLPFARQKRAAIRDRLFHFTKTFSSEHVRLGQIV